MRSVGDVLASERAGAGTSAGTVSSGRQVGFACFYGFTDDRVQRLNGEDEGVAVHALPRRGRDEQDAEFLPEDGSGHSANQADEGEESDGIRPELRALIDKWVRQR